jgi:hypothetical protein
MKDGLQKRYRYLGVGPGAVGNYAASHNFGGRPPFTFEMHRTGRRDCAQDLFGSIINPDSFTISPGAPKFERVGGLSPKTKEITSDGAAIDLYI